MKVKSSNGIFFKVSKRDYYKVIKLSWHVNADGYPTAYIKGKTISLARFILNPGPGLFADHKDRNPLNNLRVNLRLSNIFQNAQNRNSKGSSTGYRGVYRDRKRNKFRAMINVAGNRIMLPRRNTAKEAFNDYVSASKKHHGKFSYYK